MLLDRYAFVDLAFKVVGVGSVGTRDLVVLLMGRDDGDPLILQLKEAKPSVLEPYAGRSRYARHGHRVVAGQRLMQAAGDPFLGWVRGTGAHGLDLYWRQLHDLKGLDPRRSRAAGGPVPVRRPVRLDTGPRPRPLGRPHRDRRLPRRERALRPRRRRLRRCVRRPVGTRLRAARKRPSRRAGSRSRRGSDEAIRRPPPVASAASPNNGGPPARIEWRRCPICRRSEAPCSWSPPSSPT